MVQQKKPILVSVEEFRRDKLLYREGCLYELDYKQVYWIDVPPGHPRYHRPLVLRKGS